MLNTIADRIEDNLELLARVETRDNGKPIRETMNADVPLVADIPLFRQLHTGGRREGFGEIDHDTVAYHFREPLGVVGQITRPGAGSSRRRPCRLRRGRSRRRRSRPPPPLEPPGVRSVFHGFRVTPNRSLRV